MNTDLSLRVERLRAVAPGIREITLVRPDGERLPAWSAGSHVLLHLPTPGGLRRNPYSLLGDPEDRRAWRLAVRREPASRGGSAWIHEALGEGQLLTVGAPANLFPAPRTARHTVLVAGGIGITPILALARVMQREGRSFEVHDAWRDPAQAAFRDELEAVAPGRVTHHDASAGARLDFRSLLADRPLGTHLMICGPAGMVQDAFAAGAALGWPASALHTEAFAAAAGGEPFTVCLARDGRRLQVSGDRSLLDVLEDAGTGVQALCRGGACGRCETAVVDTAGGELLHADVILDPSERAAGRRMLPCVSRYRGPCLTLDL